METLNTGVKFNDSTGATGVRATYLGSEDANINFAINIGVGDGWDGVSVNGQAYKYGGHSIRPVWK